MTDYYRGLGFSHRVGREWIFNEKQNWMTLNFIIDEGPRYTVNNVSVIGNSRLQAQALMKDLKLTGGNFFDQSKLNKDITGVQDKYGEVGYIFADVQPETRFLEQPGQLDLVYKIEEGDRYRVGRIDVKIGGDNPHTRRTAVLNRLSLRTGDIANTKKLRDSERRLKASQMLANQPAQGQVPKIVFAKPGMEDEEEDDTTVARNPRGRHKGPGVQRRWAWAEWARRHGWRWHGWWRHGWRWHERHGLQRPKPRSRHDHVGGRWRTTRRRIGRDRVDSRRAGSAAKPHFARHDRGAPPGSPATRQKSSSVDKARVGRTRRSDSNRWGASRPDATAGGTRYGGTNSGVTRAQFAFRFPAAATLRRPHHRATTPRKTRRRLFRPPSHLRTRSRVIPPPRSLRRAESIRMHRRQTRFRRMARQRRLIHSALPIRSPRHVPTGRWLCGTAWVAVRPTGNQPTANRCCRLPRRCRMARCRPTYRRY